MFQILGKWFKEKPMREPDQRRSVSWIPKSEIPNRPRSCFPGEDLFSLGENPSGVLAPPGIDARFLFPMLRRLRDYIPDVSAGIWAWVRLCSTQQSYALSPGSESEHAQCRAILSELDSRILGRSTASGRGIESLVQMFFLSVFTYGSFCGEVVLDEERKQIDRFLIIDPATIRFKQDRHTRFVYPYQILPDQSLVALNPTSFFYYGLDTDGLSPYGRSPLLGLPLVVKLQQQMIHDMAEAQHNAGYPTIHFKLARPEKEPKEAAGHYAERIQQQMEQVNYELKEKRADSNLITYDDIEVEYIGPNGHTMQWAESIQAISEQVVSALHLAPFMIGRNWGTTQTWGTAQYQLLTNNARTVQEGAKRLAEWLRNLELILQGKTQRVSHHFAPHHHLDIFDRARSFKVLAQSLVELQKEDVLDRETVKQRIDTILQFL